jgi:hypothetical protein
VKKIVEIAAALVCLIVLTGAQLPETGPKPEIKPAEQPAEDPSAQQTDDPAKIDVAPKPQPKPGTETAKPDAPAAPADAGKQDAQDKPDTAGKEPPQREKQGPNLPGAALPESTTPGKQTLEAQHLTIEPESDSDHSECVKELQSLGVVFTDLARIDDGNGCGIDKPIKVTEALPGIRLKPDGVFRCPVALALARWMKGTVIPAAAVAAADQGRITTINQASSYICRLRNSAETGKISEHARGNAVDIASFSFEKGEDIAVKPRREDSTLIGAFQRTVSAAGCLYFTTVLDPESDAAHETHFHLDVLERKGGYRYCH